MFDVPLGRVSELSQLLEERLTDEGLDVSLTAERVAGFHRVENTYLSTFQFLGGLGLLLGTLGLAVVLLRNVLERRRELAVLRAVGYTPRHLATIVASENAFLLLRGTAIGDCFCFTCDSSGDCIARMETPLRLDGMVAHGGGSGGYGGVPSGHACRLAKLRCLNLSGRNDVNLPTLTQNDPCLFPQTRRRSQAINLQRRTEAVSSSDGFCYTLSHCFTNPKKGDHPCLR